MNEPLNLMIAFISYALSWLFYLIFFFKPSQIGRRFAGGIYLVGLLFHTAALLFRWKASGHAPFSNMYESLLFFSWAYGLTFLFVQKRLDVARLGFLAVPLNLALLTLAFSHDASVKPLVPALQSNWMLLHVTSCFLAYSAFAVSFVASVVFLTPLQKKFGAAEVTENIIYQTIYFGFPLLTLGIAAGAVWANEAWGTYWSWDPKETWALITWFIYALYLHLRLMKGWEGKRLVWVSFFGFLSVAFTYWGVSYFLTGLHSYA